MDLLGPSSNCPNNTTVRPSDTRVFGDDDTWVKDCTDPAADDGTKVQAGFVNGLIAQQRAAIRGMGIAVNNADDTMLLDAIVSAGIRYGLDTGAVNALVLTLDPPIAAYQAGRVYAVKVGTPNSAAATLNVDGKGAKNILHTDGNAMAAGDLVAGKPMLLIDDGTNFYVLNRYAFKLPYVADSGAANALVGNFAPAITALFAGLAVEVKVAYDNTGATTLKCNALSAVAVTDQNGNPLQNGDMVAGRVAVFIYDGTNFQVNVQRSPVFLNRIIKPTPGAWSWTVPAGVKKVKVSAWSGGGGGGFGVNGSPSGGGSGGAGGSKFEKELAVNPGDGLVGAVGPGGAAGTGGGTNGSPGGDTTLTYNAITYTAGGGTGGNGANAGVAQNSVSGGSVTGSVEKARSGQPSFGAMLCGSSPTQAGGGGSCPDGGYAGQAGTGGGNPGGTPGGGGAGSAAGQPAGAGARGEVVIEW